MPLVVLLAAGSALAGPRHRGHRPEAAVVLFEHVGFEGRGRELSGDVAFVGSRWNDLVSSLRIPPGKKVVLYQHADFTGATLVLSGDVRDLRAFRGWGRDGTWNDTVSSLRVVEAGSACSVP